MKKIPSSLNIKFLLPVFGFLLCLGFFDLSNLDGKIYKQLCNPLSYRFLTKCTDYYDIPIWTVLASLGTIVALYAAWSAIRQSNKQLEIEQTPYVALDHIKRLDNRYGFSVWNIGKGSAIHITFCTSEKVDERNNPFFSDDQSHSINLNPHQHTQFWEVDGERLDNLKPDKNNFAYLYIFFESQSNDLYITKTKIKRITKNRNAEYVVMENKYMTKTKLKEGVGV